MCSKRGVAVLFITLGMCPDTQEREVQLSFYLKILESSLFRLGCRRDYLVLSLVCLSIFFPSDSLVLFLSPPPHVPSLVSLLISLHLSSSLCSFIFCITQGGLPAPALNAYQLRHLPSVRTSFCAICKISMIINMFGSALLIEPPSPLPNHLGSGIPGWCDQ